ncbi:hypothetical protein D3C77_369740 [compost metagenome]
MREPIVLDAFSRTVTTSSQLNFPCFTKSATMYSVIILVILAGGSGVSPFTFRRTWPDTGSNNIADLTLSSRDSTDGMLELLCCPAGLVDVASVCCPSASATAGTIDRHNIFSNRTEATLLRRIWRFDVLGFFSFSFNALKAPLIYSFDCLIYSITAEYAKKDRPGRFRPVCYGKWWCGQFITKNSLVLPS